MSPSVVDWTHVRRILCLGAHSDDIEIGCGATVLKLIAAKPNIEIFWQVFTAGAERRREARQSAAAFLSGAANRRVVVSGFRESYFPTQWAAIKDAFERIRKRFEPDLVFTHWRDDRHQDHRVLSDLAWNTFRGHTILEYEIPKYDGDLGNPNLYVAIDEALARRKAELLMRHFASQRTKHWFSEDTFLGLMRIRGMEAGPATRYAEAFHARKLLG